MSATDRLVTDADLGHIYAQYPLASELDALDSIVRREVAKELRARAEWVRGISAGWASDIADGLDQRADEIEGGQS